jgi:hypothetical protein
MNTSIILLNSTSSKKDDDEQVLRRLLSVYMCMCVCALTCFDAVEESEREEKRKKIVHSLVLSINVASIRLYRKKELKSKKKKKHYVLLNTGKRSINRSTVAYLI